MFRDYFEKGKEWMDKITSAVMNYTELEMKVREATNDQPWGPHGKIMDDLARETHDYDGLSEIMTMLWTRIFPENPFNWRRVYKGLVVLAHLLRRGSDRVVDAARDHIYDLRTLENYQCIDERGRDQGASVRAKVHEVIELIQDAEFLQAERQKAQTNQKVYFGFGNTGGHGCGPSTNNYRFSDPAGGDNVDDEEDYGGGIYHFPTRSQPQAEMPWRSSNNDGRSANRADSSPNTSLSPQPPNRLGSFESWKGGRERSAVDSVTDKLSSALHMAKVVTSDFFGLPRVPPPTL